MNAWLIVSWVYPINKALFEAISVNLAALNDDQRRVLTENKDRVKDVFMGMMEDEVFNSAVSQGTGNSRKVRVRFEGVERMFRDILNG